MSARPRLEAVPADRAPREFRTEQLEADLVVVGGGMSGTCAAIVAARAGARVIVVHDRPVLGGNASSEVRLWVLGATSHGGSNGRWAREGGLIDELLVENVYRNPGGNAVIFDTLLLEKAHEEPNLTLLLDTAAVGVEKDGERIAAVRAFCGMDQTVYELRAPLFCDASGDGVLGFLAGAAFRVGAESREELGEPFAPSDAWGSRMGHSLFFYSKDLGHPVPFVAPSFALEDITRIPHYRSFNTSEQGCMLWWVDYGGRLDTIHDTERIKWELWRIVYGVWNHLKNSGDFPEAENLTLEWVGLIPGRRESRRCEGHYMLRQQDIMEQVEHADGVAFGGWAIDLHPADGVYSEEIQEIERILLWPRGTYQIPYRCLVSRDVPNLFLAGRLISASHVAFGSTRVMGTGAHMGQAVGMAAALCTRGGLDPADLLEPERMRVLRRELLRRGQHIPGVRLEDPEDLVQQATLSASSELVLDELPADGPAVPLDCSRAQLLPLDAGPLPRVTFTLDVSAPTTLRVEARAGHRPDGYTPELLLGAQEVALAPGAGQRVEVAIDAAVDVPRYVFFCLMANEHVAVRASAQRVTGLTSLCHVRTQEADEGIGRPRVEFWGPLSQVAGGFGERPKLGPPSWNLAVAIAPPLRPFAAAQARNGFSRPTAHPNAWVAARADELPAIEARWERPQRIARVELSFDTDFDHPMESVLITHPERAVSFCVRRYRLRAGEQVVAACEDNHQTRAVHVFDPPLESDRLALELLESNGDVPAAVFELRCYAP